MIDFQRSPNSKATKDQISKLVHTFQKMKQGLDKFGANLIKRKNILTKDFHQSSSDQQINNNQYMGEDKMKAYELRIRSLEETLRKAYAELRTHVQENFVSEANSDFSRLEAENADLKTELEIVCK